LIIDAEHIGRADRLTDEAPAQDLVARHQRRLERERAAVSDAR